MNLLNKFLGTARWRALADALRQASSVPKQPAIGTVPLLISLIVAATPVLYTFLDALTPETRSQLPTVAFGVCTVLAILIRKQWKLPFQTDPNWPSHLSLTHTAVALGCIPAVILLIFFPELLAERSDLLTQTVAPEAQQAASRPSMLIVACLIVAIAGWASITEEIIFRGLLVSMARRWAVLPTQRQRDIFAGTVSALLFGLAHYATWGPIASIALIGLGLGFVLGYLANDEHVMPLILYHFVFDVLSISVSVFA